MKSAIDVASGQAKMREELKPGMTEDELWSILHKTNIEYGGEWIECRILSSGEKQTHGCKKVVTSNANWRNCSF